MSLYFVVVVVVVEALQKTTGERGREEITHRCPVRRSNAAFDEETQLRQGVPPSPLYSSLRVKVGICTSFFLDEIGGETSKLK